ncbi:MAG: glucose-6-phosphate dehydrogenase [Dehalococcoidia bacterium]
MNGSDAVEPHLFVIFGSLGDLTRRKLLPAVYNLSAHGRMGEEHIILGVDVADEYDDDTYRAWVKESLQSSGLPINDEDASYWCDCRIHYQSIGSGDMSDYESLASRLAEVESEHELPPNHVFYLALPLEAVSHVVEGLGKANLNNSSGWTRLVLEKPFGRDLASARVLNSRVHRFFDESQIYRIDHYLGKETVQNLLAFRFANAFIEHLWNREHIESIQITVAEDAGVEHRAGYYDRAGAIRDMIQNHLTQLLCLIAMEIPAAFDARSLRYEKLKVLRQVTPVQKEDVVLGQYTRGMINGEEVAGYQEEAGISRDSHTEAFAAMKLEVANWRWKGTPFYLRTGKRLAERRSQVVVFFERAPVSIFHPFHYSRDIKPNILVLTIQPDEGIDLRIQVKSVGDPFELTTQQLKFRYTEAFGNLPDAYETLLVNVVAGDQTLFVCNNQVETSWQIYDNVMSQESVPVHSYPAGAWGPKEIDQLGAPWFNGTQEGQS